MKGIGIPAAPRAGSCGAPTIHYRIYEAGYQAKNPLALWAGGLSIQTQNIVQIQFNLMAAIQPKVAEAEVQG